MAEARCRDCGKAFPQVGRINWLWRRLLMKHMSCEECSADFERRWLLP